MCPINIACKYLQKSHQYQTIPTMNSAVLYVKDNNSMVLRDFLQFPIGGPYMSIFVGLVPWWRVLWQCQKTFHNLSSLGLKARSLCFVSPVRNKLSCHCSTRPESSNIKPQLPWSWPWSWVFMNRVLLLRFSFIAKFTFVLYFCQSGTCW